MKPTLRRVTPNPKYSFTIRKDRASDMFNTWHYHPEFEILLIKKSSGTWLIGDYVGNFKSGDIAFLGPNLPHCYDHNKRFLTENSRESGETIGILFESKIFGKEFLELPENKPIKDLLLKSSNGLKITGDSKKKCASLLKQMLFMDPTQRLISLLKLLYTITEKEEYSFFCTRGFSKTATDDQARLKYIFDYSLQNFHGKILIEDIASSVCMTGHSFCKFFKKKTRKTYMQFLMEVRIGMACRLLVEDEKNVTEICYDCGYNNFSHFHIHFKKLTGMKPLEYKKLYIKNGSR